MRKFLDGLATVVCVVIMSFTVAAVLFWVAQCIVQVYEVLNSGAVLFNADVANIC